MRRVSPRQTSGAARNNPQEYNDCEIALNRRSHASHDAGEANCAYIASLIATAKSHGIAPCLSRRILAELVNGSPLSRQPGCAVGQSLNCCRLAAFLQFVLKAGEIKIDDGRCVECKNLAEDQAANHGITEGPARGANVIHRLPGYNDPGPASCRRAMVRGSGDSSWPRCPHSGRRARPEFNKAGRLEGRLVQAYRAQRIRPHRRPIDERGVGPWATRSDGGIPAELLNAVPGRSASANRTDVLYRRRCSP
jgi:hypothetical protein